jgi:hypothetical protein
MSLFLFLALHRSTDPIVTYHVIGSLTPYSVSWGVGIVVSEILVEVGSSDHSGEARLLRLKELSRDPFMHGTIDFNDVRRPLCGSLFQKRVIVISWVFMFAI